MSTVAPTRAGTRSEACSDRVGAPAQPAPDAPSSHLGRTWFDLCTLLAVIVAIVTVSTQSSSHSQWLLLQRTAAVIFSLLPGFLYVRFTESRGPAVWNEYVFNLHRLQIDKLGNLPATVGTAGVRGRDGSLLEQNIYIQKFDAHYGRSNRRRWQTPEPEPGAATQGSAPAVPGDDAERHSLLREIDTLVPVLLTSILLALGAVTLIAGPAFLAHGTPSLLDEVRAALLGSYIFILQFLVRRYFQNDLKPSAYLAATERLVVVPLLVLGMHVLFPSGDQMYIPVAFSIGLFPIVGLRAINSVAARLLHTFVPTMENNYPLSDLDGMTIWYEARLLEEGIEDMQSLVTANMVDLMLHTRIPVGRLVDWMDQAHLFLHLPAVPKSKTVGGQRPVVNTGGERGTLRRFGIRGATDLEDAFAGYADGGTGSDRLEAEDRSSYFTGLKRLLNRSDGEPSLTLTVLRCLSREPSLQLVRNWKAS